MTSTVPWWAKIAGKLVLSRLPLSYGQYAKIRIFRHGRMDDPSYALGVFRRHFDAATFPHKHGGFVALELGPGDSAVSAVIAQAHGASRCYLIDAGDYAVGDIATYRRLVENLRAAGVEASDVDDCTSVDDLLQRVGGVYLTEGLQSLRSLPDAGVDFVWSQAVLEHIRLAEFDATLAELMRVLRPGGVASHRVDLQDHLGASLHNLRFDESVWEADWMASSGFYTNRIRFGDMIERFRAAGFEVDISHVDRWQELPLPRTKLAEPFRSYPDDELLVLGFDVTLTRPASGPSTGRTESDGSSHTG